MFNKKRAEVSARFFKTGKGEYGEGDIFLGVTVPVQRKIARNFLNLKLSDISHLLKSKMHEYRFTALENLVFQYEKGDEKKKKEIFNFYLKHTKRVNNWDLVDTSAQYIVGDFLYDKNRDILFKLAKSKNLWERRIAIVATQYFINKNDFESTLELVGILLHDKEDLIHKACGWMLREVGKKGKKQLEAFLRGCYKIMPRTMLRYSIERFPAGIRQKYLKGLI